ncbi:MAG: hypothetical protein HYR85_14630 [Planctomycetes bacterium]|nr:hypothetical protein [Planctomycetota bacterium]MBI3845582.1 hypothetical protein [Planctomycetota bacterium]
MSKTTLRPLSVGELLDGAFTIYRRHAITLVTTTFLILLPVFALDLASIRPPFNTWISSLFAVIAGIAVTWQVSEIVMGQPTSVMSGIRRCLSRLNTTLGAKILAGFIVVLGTLLFIIPGILAAIRYFAVTPAAVFEESEHPLKRSAALAADSGGRIFLVWLLMTILTFVPAIAIGGIAGAVIGATTGRPSSKLISILGTLITVIAIPFSETVMTLLYFDQRVRKEGFDVKLAAAEIGEAFAEAGPVPMSPAQK